MAAVWSLSSLMSWLGSLGFDDALGFQLPLVDGTQEIPKAPDRICIVTPTTGPGESMEGLADTTGVQLRWRGRQRGADDVMETARICDQLVRFSTFPALVDGVWLSRVERAGAAPTLLTGGPDTAQRAQAVCNYNLTSMEVLP